MSENHFENKVKELNQKYQEIVEIDKRLKAATEKLAIIKEERKRVGDKVSQLCVEIGQLKDCPTYQDPEEKAAKEHEDEDD